MYIFSILSTGCRYIFNLRKKSQKGAMSPVNFLNFHFEMPKPANYFPAIDGLRLLASLNIVMLHLGSSSAITYLSDCKWLMPIISAPAFAAGIFYVLAGFLFASKFSDPERRIPVIPFMFSRIAKLYRLHFFMTLLMFVVVVFKMSGYAHVPSFSEIGD